MILSLDTSLNNTGYAIFDDKGKLIEYGVLKSKGAETWIKTHSTNMQISALMAKYDIDTVVVEQPGHKSYARYKKSSSGNPVNAESMAKNNMAFGAITNHLYSINHQLKIIPVIASTWKGKRSKEIDKLLASQIAGVKIKNSDIADAITLCDWYLKWKRVYGQDVY